VLLRALAIEQGADRRINFTICELHWFASMVKKAIQAFGHSIHDVSENRSKL